MDPQVRERGFKFSDDPMFKRVLRNENICKGVLERVLKRPIDGVDYLNTEQEEYADIPDKGIRMDAYLVESGGRFYDVEMQVDPNPMLPKRIRSYQAVLDASSLKSGQSYLKLRESYIIFICLFDPFGKGLPVYSIERTCLEDAGVEVACGAHWMVLNASAFDEVQDNDGLAGLLQYVYTGKVPTGDTLVEEIEAEVKLNNDRSWVAMLKDSITVAREEALRQGLEQGLEQGANQGIDRFARLASRLIDAGRLDDLKQASSDSKVRKKLFEEFDI